METQTLDDALDSLREAIRAEREVNGYKGDVRIALILSHLVSGNLHDALFAYSRLPENERAYVKRLLSAAYAVCVLGDYDHG